MWTTEGVYLTDMEDIPEPWTLKVIETQEESTLSKRNIQRREKLKQRFQFLKETNMNIVIEILEYGKKLEIF